MLDEKRVVTLNDYEQRLMVRGLTDSATTRSGTANPPRMWTISFSKL